MPRRLTAGLTAAVAAALTPAVAGAWQDTEGNGFTEAQVALGRAVYAGACAECHGAVLEGGSHGPALTGLGFESRWVGRTAAELFAYIRDEMPPGLGGTLSEDAYAGLVALVIQSNARAPGGVPFTAEAGPAAGPEPQADPAAIAAALGLGGAAGAAGDVAARTTRYGRPRTPALTPVTDALLQDPPAADWPSWRRTLDNHGYSPLDQIDRDTVGGLRLAWAVAIEDGNSQTTPLVHDGVMFLAHPGNVVQALDAATGDVLWEYRHPLPDDAARWGATRTLALYGDKVFLATYDARLVALDARTGAVAWETVKADYTQGFMQFGGPVVANGVVVSGINGCQRYKDETCFITGHDPDTGRELWRTSTHRAARRPEQRLVGRRAAASPGRRRHVDSRQLRPGPRSLLHRHRAGQAVGGREPGHVDPERCALHQLDPRPEPAQRPSRVVLPARARRDARHGQRLRARARQRRRPRTAVHHREGRHPVEARPPHRRLRRPAGDAVPGHLRVDRPRDRAGDVPAATSATPASATPCRRVPGCTVATTGRRRPTTRRAGRW